MVKYDLLMRTLGFGRQVDAQVATLRPETRALLEGYAAGVNAWLDSHGGALPPEFLALARPAPWTPADSLLWAKLMALRLSGNWRDELRNVRLDAVLGPGDWADLFPDEPAASHPTIAGDDLAALAGRTLLSAVPELLTSYGASNLWAVEGARTGTGKPVLANDPHLMLQVPSTWYLARLETPEGVLAGATSPGVPVVLIGHNGHIAWGLTTTHSDTQDFAIETLDPEDPSRYLTPDGPRPFETRSETIPVRGGEAVEATLRQGRFGPVVSDAVGPKDYPDLGEDRVATLAWPALTDRDSTPDALVALNRARGWDDFREAMRLWQAPQQNVFYADVEGHIGFWSPGLVPIRLGYDGSRPVDARDREAIWSGFVPFESLPHALDPAQGWLANANNRIAGRDYPFSIAKEWQNPARYRRIAEVLEAQPRHGPEEAAALQLDQVSLSARRLLPLLLESAPAEGEANPAE
ncbi:MAG: penicillin acylase family protein, partial [Tistlia sp.]